MRFAAAFAVFLLLSGAFVIPASADDVVVPNGKSREQRSAEARILLKWLDDTVSDMQVSGDHYQRDLQVISRQFNSEGWGEFLEVMPDIFGPPVPRTTITFQIQRNEHRVMRRSETDETLMATGAIVTAIATGATAAPKTLGRADLVIKVGSDRNGETKILGFKGVAEPSTK